jgi:hypothetical protein
MTSAGALFPFPGTIRPPPVIPDDQKYIVFIRDKVLTYTGLRIHNCRASFWDVPEVHAYLKTIGRMGILDDTIDDTKRNGLLPDRLIEQKEELRSELRNRWESLRNAWNRMVCKLD